jgi:hypothetical protein
MKEIVKLSEGSYSVPSYSEQTVVGFSDEGSHDSLPCDPPINKDYLLTIHLKFSELDDPEARCVAARWITRHGLGDGTKPAEGISAKLQEISKSAPPRKVEFRMQAGE